jgi:hypothetical protein
VAMYVPRVSTSVTPHSAHRVHLCVPHGSHNKQRLFSQRALSGWALLRRRDVSCEVRTGFTIIIIIIRCWTCRQYAEAEF